MIGEERVRVASNNVRQYIADGLLKAKDDGIEISSILHGTG